MVEIVSDLCFPKSKEYLKMMESEIIGSCPVFGDSFSEQDSLTEFMSYVIDISYPVSLFLRLFALESECPCGCGGGLSR